MSDARALSIDRFISEALGQDGKPAGATPDHRHFRHAHKLLIAQLTSGAGPVIIDAPALRSTLVNEYIAAADEIGCASHLLMVCADEEACRGSRPELPAAAWGRYRKAQGILREMVFAGQLLGYRSVVLGSRRSLEALRQLRFEGHCGTDRPRHPEEKGTAQIAA